MFFHWCYFFFSCVEKTVVFWSVGSSARECLSSRLTSRIWTNKKKPMTWFRTPWGIIYRSGFWYITLVRIISLLVLVFPWDWMTIRTILNICKLNLLKDHISDFSCLAYSVCTKTVHVTMQTKPATHSCTD